MGVAQIGDAQRREIESRCLKLIHDFAHFIDHDRYDELLGLLTKDCTFEWPGNKMSGPDLVATLQADSQSKISRHVLSVPFFESVTADAVKCISYLTLYEGERGEGVAKLLGPTVVAEYYDTFRRDPADWRISSRLVKVIMMQ